jgi:hypothetical protein
MVVFTAGSHVLADFVDFHDGFAVVIMAGDHASDIQGHQDFSAEVYLRPHLLLRVTAKRKVSHRPAKRDNMDTEDKNDIVRGKILQWPGAQVRLKGRPAAIAFPAMATGALAIGALAVGALAIGALAIGSLAIGRFAIGKGKIKSLEIDDLTVGTLRVLKHGDSSARPD